MHESGELAEALEACKVAPGGGKEGPGFESCGGYGGARFVPCDVCSGSCKVFVEDKEGTLGAFRRCPEFNQNGLVRCPICVNEKIAFLCFNSCSCALCRRQLVAAP